MAGLCAQGECSIRNTVEYILMCLFTLPGLDILIGRGEDLMSFLVDHPNKPCINTFIIATLAHKLLFKRVCFYLP